MVKNEWGIFWKNFKIASSLRLGRSRPVSRVLFLRRGGSHQSRPVVANRLEQSTRKHRAGRPQALSYLILLRIGFTKLPPSPGVLVGSYPTFSPLPPEKRTSPGRLCLFCGTFLRVAPTPRYGVSCPVEPGLSSLPTRRPEQRLPGLLRHCRFGLGFWFRFGYRAQEPVAGLALVDLHSSPHFQSHLRLHVLVTSLAGFPFD